MSLAKNLLVSLLMSAVPFASAAATLVGGHPICDSEAALDDFVNDYENLIREKRCMIPKGGLPVTILSGAFTLRIRIHLAGGKSIVVYTPHENVRR